MIRATLAAGVLAAAFATSAAHAQDVVPFQGLRLEGLLGYDSLQSPYPGDAAESEGILFGIGAGYDIRRGNLTIGGEAELTDASTDTRADDTLVAGDRLVIDARRDIYVGGRLGYVVSPTTLLYGKAGYTNARTGSRYTDPTGTYHQAENDGGLRFGGGAEVALSANSYVKGEYRYSDYGADAIDHRHQLVAGFGLRF